jgi:hypothetical protein
MRYTTIVCLVGSHSVTFRFLTGAVLAAPVLILSQKHGGPQMFLIQSIPPRWWRDWRYPLGTAGSTAVCVDSGRPRLAQAHAAWIATAPTW